MRRKITAYFDEHQVKKMIDSIIREDISNRDDITSFFLNMMFDHYGLHEPFIHMMTNCTHDQIYFQGDTVYVQEDCFFISTIDKEASIKNKYLEGGYFRATVKAYLRHKRDCYHVSIDYISGKNPDGLESYDTWVSPTSIRKDNVTPSKDHINFGDLL